MDIGWRYGTCEKTYLVLGYQGHSKGPGPGMVIITIQSWRNRDRGWILTRVDMIGTGGIKTRIKP